MNDQEQAQCQALGEPEDGIELRCCLPSRHEGRHSFVITLEQAREDGCVGFCGDSIAAGLITSGASASRHQGG